MAHSGTGHGAGPGQMPGGDDDIAAETCRILSGRTDGFGFYYGQIWRGRRGYDVNFLPPEAEWSGDLRSHEPDPARWIVFIDGEEIARTEDKSALGQIVTAHIAQGPGAKAGPAPTL